MIRQFENRKDKIVGVAINYLKRSGVKGTCMDALAREAGTQPAKVRVLTPACRSTSSRRPGCRPSGRHEWVHFPKCLKL